MSVPENHPIHRLLIHTDLKPLTAEDLKYWSSNGYELSDIPGKFGISTGSTRKAASLSLQLHWQVDESGKVTVPFSKNVDAGYQQAFSQGPLALYIYLRDNIRNGDGSFPGGEILLGAFHGVPVYADTQSAETKEKDPAKQARLKAEDLLGRYGEGDNAIILANDCLDSVQNVSRVSRSSRQSDPNPSLRPRKPLRLKTVLGKPENEEDFPRGNLDLIPSYVQKYIAQHFRAGRVVMPTIAVAAADTRTGVTKVSTHHLSVRINSEKLSTAVPDLQGSGAGYAQQLIELDNDAQSFRKLFQITGAPAELMLNQGVQLRRPIQ